MTFFTRNIKIVKNPNYKGSYEYLAARKRQYLAYAVLCALGVAGFFLLGWFLTHTRKNIFILPALFCVIPFSNFVSALIAMSSGASYLPGDKREQVQRFEDAGMLYYHLMYCDEKGKRQFMDCVVFYQGGIVAYCSKQKVERKTDIESDCITRLKKKGTSLRLKIYTDWDEFTKRIGEIEAVVPEDEAKKVEKAEEQFLNLCL